MYSTAFPDLRVPIEDLIAEGDRVVTRLTAEGGLPLDVSRHAPGRAHGLPPTGKQVTITGITINRVSRGKVEEQWNNFDQLGMLQQLGVAPAPGQAGG